MPSLFDLYPLNNPWGFGGTPYTIPTYNAVLPYSGDMLTYGERPEHMWFNMGTLPIVAPGGPGGGGSGNPGDGGGPGAPGPGPGSYGGGNQTYIPTLNDYHEIGGDPSRVGDGLNQGPGGQSPFGGGLSLPGLGGLFGGQQPQGGLQSTGMPSLGQGWGTGLGLVGGLLGLGLGVPGTGILGSLVGTGIDISNANSAIRGINSNKNDNINSLGLDAFLGAMLNGATLGIFGRSIGDAARANIEQNGWGSTVRTGGLNSDGSFTKDGALVAGNSTPLARDAGWAAAVDAKAGGGYWGSDSAWDGKSGGYGPVGPKEDGGGFNGTEQGTAKDGSEPGGGAESGKGGEKFSRGGRVYEEGGEIEGEGDGQSDDVPALIDGQIPARLSTDEYVIPADVVAALGAGSSRAGHRRLNQLTEQVRQHAMGTRRQMRPVPQSLLRGLLAQT